MSATFGGHIHLFGPHPHCRKRDAGPEARWVPLLAQAGSMLLRFTERMRAQHDPNQNLRSEGSALPSFMVKRSGHRRAQSKQDNALNADHPL